MGEHSETVGEGQEKQIDIDWKARAAELEAKASELEKSRARILEESKDYKTKLKQREEEDKTREMQTLQEQGKEKELIEALSKRLAEKDDVIKSFRRDKFNWNIESTINRIAPGTRDIEDVKNNLLRYGLQPNEDLTVNGLEDALKDLREKKPYLWEDNKPAAQWTKKADGTYNEGVRDGQYWEARLAECQSQAQYDAVIKERHG